MRPKIFEIVCFEDDQGNAAFMHRESGASDVDGAYEEIEKYCVGKKVLNFYVIDSSQGGVDVDLDSIEDI